MHPQEIAHGGGEGCSGVNTPCLEKVTTQQRQVHAAHATNEEVAKDTLVPTMPRMDVSVPQVFRTLERAVYRRCRRKRNVSDKPHIVLMSKDVGDVQHRGEDDKAGWMANIVMDKPSSETWVSRVTRQ